MEDSPYANPVQLQKVVEHGELTLGCREIGLVTLKGETRGRFYDAGAAATRAVVYVGGVGGGWDTPADQLYPRLCRNLLQEGISGLRIRFRNPRDMEEAVFDVLAGLQFLHGCGASVCGVVGHSFGGAVVIHGAAIDLSVKVVVTLASQSYGVAPAARLGPRSALLSLHGENDPVLPPTASSYIYTIAQQPKKVIILAGADHVLDGAAGEVWREVRSWILMWLRE